MTMALSVESLVVRRGTTKVVDQLDLQVGTGRFFGLLGPNGAGKSTTIDCIAGLAERAEHAAGGRPAVVSGTLRVLGLDPQAEPGRLAARLGVVPQSLALYPDLSVAENLRIFGGLYGLKGQALRGRVEWALGLAELSDRRAARVSALSGGMARRLNLAAALLHEPELIICDEPTTGVDPQSRNHLFEALRRLHAEGRTVVYTTHYLEEVEALCQDVAIMDRGRVIAAGTLEALVGESHRTRVLCEGTPDQVQAALAAAGLTGLSVEPERRTLEAVFLDLTGRRLREDAS